MNSNQLLSRRSLLGLLAGRLAAQGVARRSVSPQPRVKSAGPPFAATFVDVADSAGLRFPTIYGQEDGAAYIVETVGCGCAFFDFDNDGWLDVLVLSGQRFKNTPTGTSNRLYRNNRDGTFTDVTKQAGLLRTGWAAAVTIGDFDNDGFDDIFITYWGENVLYRNNGDGTFTDVTEKAGLKSGGRSFGSGCTWIDYNRDGHLDLFAATYLDFDPARTPKPGENANCTWKGLPVMCGPRGLPPTRHKLFRNNGDGTFTDVSVETGISEVTGSYAMTAVAADFNGDGWQDLLIACDSTPSYLLVNSGTGTFREEGLERGAALSEDGMEQAGMGLGVGDYDRDGDLDFFKTHFADDTHGLFRNNGEGYFDDVTLPAGLGVETRYIGWGAGTVDLDNDGWPDLFAVTGSVYPELEKKLPQYASKTPRLLFRNLGNGRFEQVLEGAGPAMEKVHSSRGCAFGDYDNDGDLDILVVNLNEPPSLLRNDGQGKGNFLKVLLSGVQSNRSAIGSRVSVKCGGRTHVQDVLAQASFYSVNDRRLHFGLGAETSAHISVRWTNGRLEEIGDVEAGALYHIREGSGIVRRQPFK